MAGMSECGYRRGFVEERRDCTAVAKGERMRESKKWGMEVQGGSRQEYKWIAADGRGRFFALQAFSDPTVTLMGLLHTVDSLDTDTCIVYA